MAVLLKLQLSGIRSFGPFEENLQQISFDTPVTLLVGQNGCGKTTILEAIKYAFTSELPSGTAKGQGFIHDPKISGASATKGQIRLKLIDGKGDTYTIVKAMQLQRKMSTMSFSSLDSAISVLYSNGEKHQIGGRCTDIDKFCSQILQVSPCIINNVLFCHQENSSWPLDEGKKVKEKFDKIFDSDKYNKCSELLGKIVKNKQDDLKLLKIQVENKKERKKEVCRQKDKLEEKREKSNLISNGISEKMENLEPFKVRFGEIEELEVELGNFQRQLTSKITEKKGLVQQQNMLSENITEIFLGEDDELKIEISLFEKKQKEKERIIEALEENRKEIEKKEKSIEKEIQESQMKLGRLKEEERQFKTKSDEQKELFEKAGILFKIENSLSYSSPEDSQTALITLKSELKEVQTKFDNLIRQKQNMEHHIQEKIDKARENLATTKEKYQSTSNDIKKNEEKILKITNEIQELDIVSNKLNEINRKIDDLTNCLENLQKQFDENSAGAELVKSRRNIEEMERKLEDLEDLYKMVQENYIIEEKLNIKNQMLVKKQTESRKIKNKHGNNFKEIFEDDIPSENIGKRVQKILESNDQEIKKINFDITAAQKEVTKLETQIKHQKADIKKYENELSMKQADVTSICQGNDFMTLLKESYEKKEKLQKEKGQFSSAKIMYERFIEVFKEDDSCCPICETNFSDKKSLVKVIIDKLKQKIKTIPEKLNYTEKTLRKEEEFYNKLQQLKPVNENIEILLNVKLPMMHEQLEADQNELMNISNKLKNLNENLKIPSKKVEICKGVIADSSLLDQYNSDIQLYEREISELMKQKKIVTSNKTKHEVESEVENMKADISSKRKHHDTLRNKLDQHKQRCQNIKDDKNRCVEMQLKYQTQANNKPNLEKQLEEVQEIQAVLLAEKNEYQSELKQSEQILEEELNEKKKLIEDNQRIINTEREELNKKTKIVEAITKISQEIINYRKKKVDEILKQTNDQVSQLEDKKKHFTEIKNKAVSKITEQKEEIAKQITVLRNLQDNVVLREKKKEETKISSEITQLEKKIGDYNYKSVYNEKIQLKKKIETVEKEISNLKGQELELKNTIADIEQELNKPENKNAERNYKEILYKYKVLGKSIEDVKKYIKALHFSILQFHKDKMKQINQRIRELWRNIYKGNDIDFIEINAEVSKSMSSVKQTYDYKVVQIKNGTELEMRGRCSAGQRVLACLIIRIALAESFSSHCGILALDEPTTNLDKENIMSLTLALSNIITSHANNNKFQLLVITHDQEFLDVLKHHVQNMSHYWRVERNPNGYSMIKKERI